MSSSETLLQRWEALWRHGEHGERCLQNVMSLRCSLHGPPPGSPILFSHSTLNCPPALGLAPFLALGDVQENRQSCDSQGAHIPSEGGQGVP